MRPIITQWNSEDLWNLRVVSGGKWYTAIVSDCISVIPLIGRFQSWICNALHFMFSSSELIFSYLMMSSFYKHKYSLTFQSTCILNCVWARFLLWFQERSGHFSGFQDIYCLNQEQYWISQIQNKEVSQTFSKAALDSSWLFIDSNYPFFQCPGGIYWTIKSLSTCSPADTTVTMRLIAYVPFLNWGLLSKKLVKITIKWLLRWPDFNTHYPCFASIHFVEETNACIAFQSLYWGGQSFSLFDQWFCNSRKISQGIG